MLKHYLAAALRHLLRHRITTTINIAGLGVGLAATLLIIQYVRFESSYDTLQPRLDDTYRLSQVALDVKRNPAEAIALNSAIKLARSRPEIEDVFALYPLFNGEYSQLLRAGNQYVRLARHYAATPNITDFVALQILAGDLSHTLTASGQIAISKSQAQRLFGSIDVVGRRLDVVGNRTGNATASWTVGAVFDDLPPNTHYDFDSLSSAQRFAEGKNSHAFAYVRFKPSIDRDKLTEALNAEVNQNAFYATKVSFHPVRRLHLATGGRQTIVNACIALSLILVAIAALNFVNMSTAQAGARAREIGVRKALGASRARLIRQFLLESVVVACAAATIAACMAQLALPWFNQLVDRELSLQWFGESALILLSLAVTIGLLAGLYPAFLLSSIGTRRVLSGELHHGQKGVAVRKSLLLLQLAGSAALLFGTVVLYKQVRFLETLPTGYAKTGLLEIGNLENRDKFDRNQTALLDELRRLPGVVSATLFDRSMTAGAGSTIDIYSPRDPTHAITSGFTGSGFDAARTLGLELIAGRDFSSEFATDWYRAEKNNQRQASILITQSMARRAGYLNPQEAVGQRFRLNIFGEENLNFVVPVAGVVADLKLGSVRTDQRPIFFICGFSWSPTVTVGLRLANADLPGVEKAARRIIGNHFGIGIQPQDARLIEDQYAAVYARERKETRLIGVFTLLAVALSCIGTFGLAAFSMRHRRREFAIRRVHGASRMHLINLLEGEYLRVALLSTLLAFPIAHYFAGNWLSQFSERIDLSAGTFLIAAGLLCGLTWLTVVALAYRAAAATPATCLRHG